MRPPRREERSTDQKRSETNQHLYRWLGLYINENPIPDAGAWEDVSGETFIRGMLQGEGARVIPEVKAALVDPLFDCSPVLGVDPRQVAQRILDIRKQVSAMSADPGQPGHPPSPPLPPPTGLLSPNAGCELN